MQIVIADFAGFCEGVERAYKMAVDAAKSSTSSGSKKKPLYMLGQLVHNRQVVEKLTELGIITVENLSKIKKPGYLLISAHGVPPGVTEKARKKGLTVIDTTCPWVKKAQRTAKILKQEGYRVIIVGDKGHPEVKGLQGWAGKSVQVIQNPKELKKSRTRQKIGVVTQTTQSLSDFESIVSALGKLNPEAKITARNTICGATTKRQNAAMTLARNVDIMLVIGDLKSANTKRLKQLCKKGGAKTHQIQSARELKKTWLKGINSVGVTAGASTPNWVIKEVLHKLGILSYVR